MRGFTLIELLVVVALVGILAAIGIPMYVGYVQGARDKSAQITIKSIAVGQESYKLVSGNYFSTPCSDQAASVISLNLMSKSPIDSSYFTYCTSVDQTKAVPNFTVSATDKKRSKQFIIDQDGVEKIVQNGVTTLGF